ncbi:hypothetical protein MMC28_002348 [Mycoblastus sanguinarius]|nr:hypothetical protein [Mycoblastus sanguinarius]
MGDSPGEMYALSVLLTLLALLAVLLRLHARRIKRVEFAWDDYLIVLALAFTTATGVCMVIGAAIGDLGSHTLVMSNGHPVFDHHTEVFLQIAYASQLTQTLAVGFTNIFVVNRFAKFGWAMIGLVIAWTGAFFISNLLQCWPISANWNLTASETTNCVHTTNMYLAQAWSDVFMDVVILSLPIPCIWNLQMPVKRKIAISAMFLLGALCFDTNRLLANGGVLAGRCWRLSPFATPNLRTNSFGKLSQEHSNNALELFHPQQTKRIRQGYERRFVYIILRAPCVQYIVGDVAHKDSYNIYECQIRGHCIETKAKKSAIWGFSKPADTATKRMAVEVFDAEDNV